MAQASSAVLPASEANGFRRRRPIDLVHLAKQTMGDRGLELEILKMFDAQLRGQVAQLKASVDAVEQRLLLHTIKGSARGVGARSVGRLAERGEDEVLQTGAVKREIIADLEVAAAEASAFISEMLED